MSTEALNAGERRGRRAVANFMRYSADVFSIVDLTHKGAHSQVYLRDKLRELDDSLGDVRNDESQRSLDANADIAAREIERDFTVLNSHTVLGLWGALEFCVDDLSIGRLMSDNGHAARDAISSVRAPIGDLLYLDDVERWEWVLENLKRNLASSLKPGIGQFESVLSAIGMGGPVDPDLRKALHIIKAVRNLIAHRGGYVDGKFLSTLPESTLSAGEKLHISSRQASSANLAMFQYVDSLGARFGVRVGESDAPDWMSSPEQILIDMNELIRADSGR